MNSDADKFWNKLVPTFRKYKGLCQTPEEIEAELDAMTSSPMPPREVWSIVESVTSCDVVESTPDAAEDESSEDEWSQAYGSEEDVEGAEQALFALYREKATESQPSSDAERDLRRLLLADDRVKSKFERAEEQRLQDRAGEEADSLVSRLGLTAPIDPIAVAKTEYPLLRVGGADLGSSYDGKLEFHRSKKVFLLFFNTRYDRGCPAGEHHSRTRFSIAHELGHFFLNHHSCALRESGRSHCSVSEFRDLHLIEREADAFAASLLIPTALARPLVNQCQLSLERIDAIASHFRASLVCTAIRSVRLSDFPCAVAGIRQGSVSWMFPSRSLIAAGIYPKKGMMPGNAAAPWEKLLSGVEDRVSSDGRVRDWFETFDKHHLSSLFVLEEYQPIPILGTLLVLVTLDEGDLIDEDEQDD